MLDRILRVALVVLNLFLAITAAIGAVWVIPAFPPASGSESQPLDRSATL
jgi:uncharacterized membrane protein